MLEDAKIIRNECLKGDYWKIEFDSPGICPEVKPGHFVHEAAKLCTRQPLPARHEQS